MNELTERLFWRATILGSLFVVVLVMSCSAGYVKDDFDQVERFRAYCLERDAVYLKDHGCTR